MDYSDGADDKVSGAYYFISVFFIAVGSHHSIVTIITIIKEGSLLCSLQNYLVSFDHQPLLLYFIGFQHNSFSSFSLSLKLANS